MLITTLGNGGPSVPRLGLGCMELSGIYGAADDTGSISTTRRALDLTLTGAELECLDAAFPAGVAAGERNQPAQLARINR